jgi:hypothetical protein
MLRRYRGFRLRLSILPALAPLELLSCGLSWLADAALCLGFLVLLV